MNPPNPDNPAATGDVHRLGIPRLCARFRARLWALTVQAGAARVVVTLIVAAAAGILLDWWLVFGAAMRLLELAALIAAVAAAGWWTLIVPARRRWSDRQVLGYLDSAADGGRGMLLDLHELSAAHEVPEMDRPVGRELAETAVEEMAASVGEADVAAALPRRRANAWSAGAAAAVLAVIVAGATVGEHVRIGAVRLLNPFSSVRWPHDTTIVIAEPASGWRAVQMESFTIHGTVTGQVPRTVTLLYRHEGRGREIPQDIPVRIDGRTGSFEYTFAKVVKPLTFVVAGGDYRTDTYEIAIAERPYITKIEAHYQYPPYVGRPNRTVPSGELDGLEGTKVRLVLACSMPLTEAVYIFEHDGRTDDPEPLRPLDAEGTTFEKVLVLSDSGRYTVELHEKHGLRESRPERHDIRVTPDERPTVELTSPGRDQTATGRASIDVAFVARDDFGLSKVEFLYAVDDGPPKVLSSRVTGPVAQAGTASAAAFTWDLRKSEDLPEKGVITCFVRAADCNPAPGRSAAESDRFRIRLVKPGEFHLQAFERAKRLLTEARIARREQLAAWSSGLAWREKGTGAVDDKRWAEMTEHQDGAFQAVRAALAQLQILTDQYRQNRMASEFMAARLGEVAGLVDRVAEAEHPAIEQGLRDATPKIDADAQPPRLRKLRADALAALADRQKMSVLILERVLWKLYDWRDLQNASITARLLQEHQEEVVGETERIAPRYIGKDILDLSDKQQEDLLTLGKRQRTIFETETELERQLAETIGKAEAARRTGVLPAVVAAFKCLRDNRVNDHLKQAAQRIENNQPYQIVNNQKAALRALDVVTGGLLLAGAKVEPDPSIDLAADVRPDADFEEVKPAAVATTTAPAAGQDLASLETMDPAKLLEALPEGLDPLSAAVRLSVEMQDNVLARTRFLGENLRADDMPRFVRLTRLALLDRQDQAVEALDRAIAEASAPSGGRPAGAVAAEVLAMARGECVQVRRLIEAGDFSPACRQIQQDTIDMVKDLLVAYMPLARSVADAAAANRAGGGLDPFKRPFVLRDNDLDATVAILADADHARLLQRDVVRKLRRFAGEAGEHGLQAARGTPVFEVERAARAEAGRRQGLVASLIARAAGRCETVSTDMAGPLRQTGLEALAAVDHAGRAGRIASADGALAAQLDASADDLATAVAALRDLLGAVQEPVAVAAAPTPTTQPISAQEFEALTSPEAIRDRLAGNTQLPPEIRAAMVQALEKPLPGQYEELLKRYYGSFAEEAPRP